ncbi:hypothetical protein [Pelagibius sp.]|uniref:hypothetical protein n=1 Tax=Pelagibius sp. TaxID=1931238 RepID=UPI00262BEEB5|nr:hypothetical protein [Pelagibius sp.]
MRVSACDSRSPLHSVLISLTLLLALATTSLGHSEELDLVMDGDGSAMGEVSTRFDLGPLHLLAEHREYFASLNLSQADEADDPLARHSRVSAAARFDLGQAVELPLTFSGDFRSFASGKHSFDFAVTGSLHLPRLNIGAALDLAQDFQAGGTAEGAADGELTFGFDWMGARHEGQLEFDVLPQRQLTELSLASRWSLERGLEAALDLTHDPLASHSEARLGLDQHLGPFTFGSDFAADSGGGYSVGITFALDLGPAPAAPEWRLSSLLTALQTNARRTAVQDSFGLLSISEYD